MKRADKTTTRYYYNDQRVAVQTQVSGGVESDFRHYVFGNYIDEVLVMGYRYSSSWIDLYYGHDHLYSPAIMFMPNGTPVERYEYDVYGAVQILTANYEPRPTSSLANPYYFTGRELDTLDAGSCKLMYYRARTYDPETGRFMQRDPHGINPAGGSTNPFDIHKQYTDGVNIYVYVINNPINHTDSYGLCACKYDSFAIMGTFVVPYKSSVEEVTLIRIAAQIPSICTTPLDAIYFFSTMNVLSKYVDSALESIMVSRGVKVYFHVCEWKCKCRPFRRKKVSVFDKCWLFQADKGPNPSPFDDDGEDWWSYPLNKSAIESERMLLMRTMLTETRKLHTCWTGKCF